MRCANKYYQDDPIYKLNICLINKNVEHFHLLKLYIKNTLVLGIINRIRRFSMKHQTLFIHVTKHYLLYWS